MSVSAQKNNFGITAKVFFAVMLIFYSCTHDKVEPVVNCNLPSTISFKHDIMPVLNTHCNTAGCHSGPSPTGNLKLDSVNAYTQLLAPGHGYVDTINPAFSIFYNQINASSKPMPPNEKLDECSKQLILKWIQQHAKNN
jgi:hypothetical protein